MVPCNMPGFAVVVDNGGGHGCGGDHDDADGGEERDDQHDVEVVEVGPAEGVLSSLFEVFPY